jgi:hypothetical protein
MLHLFKEHGIKFLFMIPDRIIKRLIPVKYSGGIVEVSESGFWKPRSPSGRSLKKAAKIFNSIEGKVIIEIGSGIQGHFSGNSVLVWARKTNADNIICLDLNPDEIDLVKAATPMYPQVEALVEDGIKYVKNFNKKIDLLYLDFWTDDPEGELPGTGRSNAYLKAYEAAKSKFSENALILIDDTDHIHPWKHTEIIPAARRDGFRVLYTGRQTLLQKQSK